MPTDTPCTDWSQPSALPAHYTRKPTRSHPQFQSGTGYPWLSNFQVKLRNLWFLWPRMSWIHPRQVNWVILLAGSSGEASPGGSLAASSVQKQPQSRDPPSHSLAPGLCPEPPAPALQPWGQFAGKAASSEHGLPGTLGPLRNPLVFHKPSFNEVGKSEVRVGSHPSHKKKFVAPSALGNWCPRLENEESLGQLGLFSLEKRGLRGSYPCV